MNCALPARLVTCGHCSRLNFLEDMAGVAANPLSCVVDSAWAQNSGRGDSLFSGCATAIGGSTPVAVTRHRQEMHVPDTVSSPQDVLPASDSCPPASLASCV